jgi:hypothetical protein
VLSSRRIPQFAAVALTLVPVLGVGAQSNVAVSPFVSYVPSATSNPLGGFALTFGGTTGLALRSSAEISISRPDSTIVGHYRPWGADADAMLFLGGLGGGATVFSRTLSPYLFTGIGLTGGDSAGRNNVTQGWSYGAGALIPLGLHADLFAEARWRMDQYVLPTAKGAPDSKSALRFGLSFHVGGSNEPARRPPPRRRNRMESYDDDEEYVVVREAPAPAAPAPQVVVVQPAPAPAPVVIVQQEREPEPTNTVNINLPGSVVVGQRSSSRGRVYSNTRCTRRSRSGRCISTQRVVQEVHVRAGSGQVKVVETRKRKPD